MNGGLVAKFRRAVVGGGWVVVARSTLGQFGINGAVLAVVAEVDLPPHPPAVLVYRVVRSTQVLGNEESLGPRSAASSHGLDEGLYGFVLHP